MLTVQCDCSHWGADASAKEFSKPDLLREQCGQTDAVHKVWETDRLANEVEISTLVHAHCQSSPTHW